MVEPASDSFGRKLRAIIRTEMFRDTPKNEKVEDTDWKIRLLIKCD